MRKGVLAAAAAVVADSRRRCRCDPKIQNDFQKLLYLEITDKKAQSKLVSQTIVNAQPICNLNEVFPFKELLINNVIIFGGEGFAKLWHLMK